TLTETRHDARPPDHPSRAAGAPVVTQPTGTLTDTTRVPPAEGGVRALRRAAAVREAGVLVALLVLCVGLSFASPYFFTLRNVFNVLQGMSTIGIMAI